MYEILQQIKRRRAVAAAADKEQEEEKAREKSGRGKLISILVSRE